MNSYFEDSIIKADHYIKNNIDRKINLSSISEASGLSKFHFHRIYQAFRGISVFEAVEEMRIENAARMLIDTSKTITEIANLSGITSSDKFKKCFKDIYDTSPTAWRKINRGKDGSKTAASEKRPRRDEDPVPELNEMASEVKTFDGFSIAYIRHTGAYAGDSALFIYLYNKLTTWAAGKELLSPERETVVIYHYPLRITEDPKSKITIGFSVPDETETDGDIGKMKLRGGEYLVVRFSLHDDQYDAAWNRVYREIMPAAGLIPADSFCFERYPSDVKSGDRYASIVDICVPVTRG